MDWDFLIRMLASILAESSPLVYACIGETITEKAGVINLSLDGSILLSAMTGFAVAYGSGSLVLGLLSAMGVGALVALIVVVAGIELRQDQVAVGFIMTLLATDLSSFLGNPFVRKPGPEMPHLAIPILKDIPVLGPLFFNHNLFTYGSFALILLAWFWIFKTGPGLAMRGVGERPEAAFARGISVRGVRYIYTMIGGSLVGLAGANFSSERQAGMELSTYPGDRLDRSGHRHLRRLASLQGCPGHLSVRRASVPGYPPSGGIAFNAHPGISGGPLCLYDRGPGPGK